MALLLQACSAWAHFYAAHAGVRTMVAFTHVAALIVAGGTALVMDRATLRASVGDDPSRARQLDALDASHATIITGLTCVIASGFLLLAADVDVLLRSTLFWTKMGLVGLLIANGVRMRRAAGGARVHDDEPSWHSVRLASFSSLALWLATTLAGVALPSA
jgi:uncharacterized membrane protein